MPSLTHEAILELFRRRPTLAPELLRDSLGVPMPPFAHVQVADSGLTEILPTERTADLVLLFRDSMEGPPQRAVIVEAQLGIDPEKRRSWWWYLVGIHTRHQCDAVLVVVTPSAAVAAWAAVPVPLGHPGVSMRPLVLGPDAIPVARGAAVAALAPELVVLSAMVHGRTEAGEDLARAAFDAVRPLDEVRARLYIDVVYASLNAAGQVILEDLMMNGTYEYQSDFAKRYVAQGRALAVLEVLTTRGVEVPPAVRERVLACADLTTLKAWLARAATATALSDVIID